MKLGAIEAGGTKFVCAVGNDKGEIFERMKVDTDHPDKTIPAVIEFFKTHQVDSLGIASFGPVDVDKDSPTYGNITSTPKPGWKDYPFISHFENELNIPVGFTTDVNGAALGELTYGAAKGLDGCLYITVGTGIGAGAISNHQLVQGFSHPEMGHILVRRHPEDHYEGHCPFHKDCLEGLAAGPAIEARWGKKGHLLTDHALAWEIEADYLAQALMQYILILAPKRIIMGGGVMKQERLFPLIREKVKDLLNGYVVFPQVAEQIDDYIVPPGLGDNAGITGALILAKEAFKSVKVK
ncbi:ROK family protein [Terrilactibacillus laevilacticus]|uniref:fructokinase n=1 Tax=Terrilactibacillus laevilacticus TaxID=1380157 RepID=A0ABW5PMV7_9BACI|nr:ROK family protein [Terrilactibacillus laevilacticus]